MAKVNTNITLDEKLKKQAQKTLSELNLDMSTAISLFLAQTIREKGIPFEIKADVPNKETIKALEEYPQMKDDSDEYPRHDSFEDLLLTINEDKKIEMNKWERKEMYDFFSGVSNPFYMVSFKVDITNLYNYVKKNGLSFYYSMIYFCIKAINSVKNFRYTIRDNEVHLLDKRRASFTDIRKGEELFYITNVDVDGELDEFVALAKEKSEKQDFFLDYEDECDDLVYISCLPKVRLTAMTNERDLSKKESLESNIPVLSWGKYEHEKDKTEITICLEVNHRFIDGIHISRFVEEFERLINELK